MCYECPTEKPSPPTAEQIAAALETDAPDLPGWEHIILTLEGTPACGWTVDGEFVAWASVGQIAAVLRVALENR